MSWILLKKLEASNSTTGRPRRGPVVSQYRASAICSTEQELRAEIKNRKEVGHLGSVLSQIRRERDWTQKSYVMRSSEVRRKFDVLSEKMDAIQEEAQIRELVQVEKVVRLIEKGVGLLDSDFDTSRPQSPLFPPIIGLEQTADLELLNEEDKADDLLDGTVREEAQVAQEEIPDVISLGLGLAKNLAQNATGSDEPQPAVTPLASTSFITSLPREESAVTAVTRANAAVPEVLPELPVSAVVGVKRKRSLSVPNARMTISATPRDQQRRLSHLPDPQTTSTLLPAIPQGDLEATEDADVTARGQDDVRKRSRRRRSRVSLDMSGIDFKKNPVYSEKLTALRRRVSQIETEEMTSRVRDFVRDQASREKAAKDWTRFSLNVSS